MRQQLLLQKRMKAPSIAASTAAALSLLQSRDPRGFDRLFQHLTPSSLSTLQDSLSNYILNGSLSSTTQRGSLCTEARQCCDQAIARLILRRLVYKCLSKYEEISSLENMEQALKHHTLPESLQEDLFQRYGGGGDPPKTWYDALKQIQRIEENDGLGKSGLWDLILEHPMTSYVPMQCQSCGHVVPDDLQSGMTDEDVGLVEEDPTCEEALLVRSGWFRGPRDEAKVFVLTCPKCGMVSRWFRSRDPHVILNPHKWGRLCGEQEDLRLDLANYLGIAIRTCLPLDWDHVWSEYGSVSTDIPGGKRPQTWAVKDDSARNFAARLNEGIGYWTGVLAVHPNPELCQDVTEDYLGCQQQGGRADDRFHDVMPRFRGIVNRTKNDASGASTQAGTVVGYALKRAGFDARRTTAEIRKAAQDFGTRAWYEMGEDETQP